MLMERATEKYNFKEVEVKKYNLWVILVLRECETSDTIHINQYQALVNIENNQFH